MNLFFRTLFRQRHGATGRLLAVILVVLSASNPLLGEERFRYVGRLGLVDAPGELEYTSAPLTWWGTPWGYSQSTLGPTFTDSGLFFGYTNRYHGIDELVPTINPNDGPGALVPVSSYSPFRFESLEPEPITANRKDRSAWVGNLSGEIHEVGLFGKEFTRNDEYFHHTVAGLTESGFLRGTTDRYNQGSILLGQATWLATSDGTTARVGLFDETSVGEFTRADGYQFSHSLGLTEAGVQAGNSHRFDASGADAGRSAWMSNSSGETTKIGFGGNGFVRNDGYLFHEVTQFTDSGYAIGSSARFDGASDLGQTAWAANSNADTIRVGFFSTPEFTHDDGTQMSTAVAVNEAGFLVGHSSRYAGTMERGQAAWIAKADSGQTGRIGLFDQYGGAEFTGSEGTQRSTVEGLTESGFSYGYSRRYTEVSGNAGDAAWVADLSGQSHRIGLFDQFGGTEFTTSLGYQMTAITQVTESGYLRGYSDRGANFSVNSFAPWVANANTGVTHRVGFTNSEFTDVNGYQLGYATHLAESGFAGGYSHRYDSTQSVDQTGHKGQAAWVARPDGTTVRLGLYDQDGGSEFTRPSDQYQSSRVTALTSSGLSVGVSTRFNPALSIYYINEVGRAAWIGSAITGETIRIGLYDLDTPGEFTRKGDLYQHSVATMLTESGYSAGTSRRYNEEAYYKPNIPTGIVGPGGGIVGLPGSGVIGNDPVDLIYDPDARETGSFDIGAAAWVTKRDHTTLRVGLTDALHTHPTSGYQSSLVTHLTETGWAAGYSVQQLDLGDPSEELSYFVGSYAAQTAWIVNIDREEQIAFQLSIATSGHSHSQVKFVSDDGIVLGLYVLFDGNSVVGERGFAYLPGQGTFDIGANLDLNPADVGWSYLRNGVLLHPDGYIFGYGQADSSTTNHNLYLVQIVPEPSAWLLLIFGAAAGLLVIRPMRNAQKRTDA